MGSIIFDIGTAEEIPAWGRFREAKTLGGFCCATRDAPGEGVSQNSDNIHISIMTFATNSLQEVTTVIAWHRIISLICGLILITYIGLGMVRYISITSQKFLQAWVAASYRHLCPWLNLDVLRLGSSFHRYCFGSSNK